MILNCAPAIARAAFFASSTTMLSLTVSPGTALTVSITHLIPPSGAGIVVEVVVADVVVADVVVVVVVVTVVVVVVVTEPIMIAPSTNLTFGVISKPSSSLTNCLAQEIG